MNREEVNKEILNLGKSYNNILLELATGFGKTKNSLDLLNVYNPTGIILIVIPKLVLITTWKDEINKWGYSKYLDNIIFTTYVSLHKYKDKEIDTIIFDEAQHITDKCMSIINEMSFKHSILLSATITRYKLYDLNRVFKNLYVYKISIKDAIDDKVLPDPRVYLIPLTLNDLDPNQIITKNSKGRNPTMIVDWKHRWDAIRQKLYKIEIHCTENEFYQNIDNDISFYKRSSNNPDNPNRIRHQRKWLQLCNQRLKWLSKIKTPIVKEILSIIDSSRSLTFCSSIEQSKELCNNTISFENKSIRNEKILNDFNCNKINHLSSCNMLNEGANLVNCKIGVFANLNSSEIVVIQRLGRLLRHESPIIIIPYYRFTREENLKDKMLENYNSALIKEIKNINDLKNEQYIFE